LRKNLTEPIFIAMVDLWGETMALFMTRDCIRCGVARVQLTSHGMAVRVRGATDWWEVALSCNNCTKLSIYAVRSGIDLIANQNINLDTAGSVYPENEPVMNVVTTPDVDRSVPARVVDLFTQAARARRLGMHDSAGAIFRKTIDVATKLIYETDGRLEGKKMADALRVRIKSLGEMKILDEDIVDLADVAAVDGNDAAHDIDPYTANEAEALEILTEDFLDRLFVKPARIAAVKAKQIAAGQRKA